MLTATIPAITPAGVDFDSTVIVPFLTATVKAPAAAHFMPASAPLTKAVLITSSPSIFSPLKALEAISKPAVIPAEITPIPADVTAMPLINFLVSKEFQLSFLTILFS